MPALAAASATPQLAMATTRLPQVAGPPAVAPPRRAAPEPKSRRRPRPASSALARHVQVPAWKPAAIAAAGASGHLYADARRAALSAVIFGSNFGANTSCIGSLGGLMMRRLAAQEGVTVTNGMLLKQGIPVMIPVMAVACFVLIQEQHI